jgi:hypothetical protein
VNVIVFIDEAGIFANPQNKTNYVCCVGGLVLPESLIDRIFEKFKALKTSWGLNCGEVKGSSLGEQQVASVISLLARILFINLLQSILGYKKTQMSQYTSRIKPEE